MTPLAWMRMRRTVGGTAIGMLPSVVPVMVSGTMIAAFAPAAAGP